MLARTMLKLEQCTILNSKHRALGYVLIIEYGL